MQCSVSAGAALSPPHLNIIALHNVQLNTLQLSELVRHDPQLSISEILRLLRAGGADGNTIHLHEHVHDQS